MIKLFGRTKCPDLEVSVPRWAGAPKVARARAREWCEECELSERNCDTVVLLLSELVMNAVMHADAPRERSVQINATLDSAVHVTVTDGGAQFPGPSDPDRPGGFGLKIDDSEAERWGITRNGATCVWFDRPLGAGTP